MKDLIYPQEWQDVEASIARLSDKQILFVCGAVKSGTTWTQLWLDHHPQIVCRGEGCFFNVYAGALQQVCQETSKFVLRQNATKFSDYPIFPQFNLPHVQYLLRQSVLALLATYGDRPEIRVVAEKNPPTLQSTETVLQIFPEAKILNLVRDGRDMAVSTWHENMRRNAQAFKDQFPTLDDFMPEIAKIWANAQTIAVSSQKTYPTQFRQIHYEDLLHSPQPIMADVFAWLGVKADPDTVAECCAATSFKALSGGRDAGQTDDSSFFRCGVEAQWRLELTPAQQDIFWQIAGDAMQAQGYDKDGRVTQ
ncbi:sulfotransferase family protein [Hwanghaeella sp. LZ110]|uniref:sulfotransferase family protein n=1 Tax=Hwanghaeella sp. LZ110 TaxID=3402810 RepID=UPI003B67A095